MSRAQTTGIVLIAGAIIDLLLFFYGLARRSYLALALPVMAAMFAVTALTIWVGWTMMTMEEDDEEAPVQPMPPGEQ
jgi:hypothetical protein